ncbi:MAG: hypothetical protein JWP09_804 [Candidatus Taylorbacteria bacterium]|nr:hypothetical protein [Candidatus Taylorbacteria bacterium]
MKTKHLPLIIGISLPVIFIIIISVVVFTPSLYIKPQHNFLYSTDDNNYGYSATYKNTYIAENNQLSIHALPVQLNGNYAYKEDSPTLYLYDVKTNSSHQITFDEAKKYTIDSGPSSQDGYTVKYEYNNDGIFGLFGSGHDGSGYFIEKGNGRRELTGLTSSDRYYYQGNFNLIGWIK